ncbi:MAG TPA: sulfatase-like hydrolase/transferase [Polyangiaceae bacterium]|nr:sulfatase-like hydrolase/transferase [Polyangiaceae bacterium]
MRRLAVLLLLGLSSRCASRDPGVTEAPKPVASVTAATAPGAETSARKWIDDLSDCDVEHEGVFLDVGSPATDSRRDHTIGPFDASDVHVRGGASFARIHGRRLAFEFAVLEPMQHVDVSVRAMGVASRAVNVYVDERRLGVIALSRDDPKIASLPLEELAAGTHTVTLRFSGGREGADEPFAEVDYIRIGPPIAQAESYAPPTLRDIVTDVVLDGVPERSVVLRSPATVRCTLRVAPGMRLRASAGYWGNGRGLARVRVVEDGETPRVVAERKVTGGTGAVWTPLSVDLAPYAGHVIGVELSAVESGGSGRVAFGEPATVAGHPTAPPESGNAAAVVVIVASGLDRRSIPPWGPGGTLPALGRLVHDGVAFDRYRAVTTVVPAVFATLLTGLPPRAHGLEDPVSRLLDEVRLIGERAKEGSVHSALFTGVPLSFPAFGFERGWDQYEAISPVKDLPAAEPLFHGAAWLKEQYDADHDARSLLVVHVRGGHPPWDVTRDEVSAMPPEEYAGALEPRAGAIVLANLRGLKKSPAEQRLTADDWRRLRALQEAALSKQDAGIRRVVEVLDREGLYARSLVIVMGDVAAGDPPGIPYAPLPLLHEDVLMTPLIVKFPGGAMAGTQASAMTTTVDVTSTILRALGVGTEGIDGTDLSLLAKGDLPIDGHPAVATLGTRYATRFGQWLLLGDLGRRPFLCQIEVDPSCASDALAQSPVAAEALWRRTFHAEAAALALRQKRPPTQAVFDVDTASALKVFGY